MMPQDNLFMFNTVVTIEGLNYTGGDWRAPPGPQAREAQN